MGPPYDAGLYRNGTFEVRELRIEEDNAYLRQLNEVWIEQLLDSIATCRRSRARCSTSSIDQPCRVIRPVTRYWTRSPIVTAWSPMRS